MTRVLIGDALVNENERLQLRINQFLDRIETTLKQSLRIAITQGKFSAEADIGAHANLLVCYVIGRWQQFGKVATRAIRWHNGHSNGAFCVVCNAVKDISPRITPKETQYKLKLSR